MRRRNLFSSLLFAGFIATLALALTPAPTVSAASSANFNAGRIIDDGIFFNGESMSVNQIQAFIAAKVPSCDTWGTQQSSHWNSGANRYYSRAEWGALNGNPAPYVCLKDYRMDVPNRAPDSYCSGAVTGGNKSAAQVIAEVSRACQVNPQAMLVLLQKEQGLLSDDWPWKDQYDAATGFACPDTARCDADFAGLFNQLYFGARQYQRYAKQSSSFNYRPYTSPYVQYNPSSSCGGTNIYIHGQATAGLYNYTPYQPNAAALNNLYGTGDSCSAYGNRNFWRMFSDWFGSTQAFNASVVLSQGLTSDAGSSTVYEGQTVTASYEVSNSADYEILAGGLGICARLNGQNYDFGFIGHNPIAAHGKKVISFSKTMGNAGTLSLFTCSYHASLGGWTSGFYPYSNGNGAARTLALQVVGNPWIHTGVTLSPSNPATGQTVTATITIANASTAPVNIGTLVVAARDPYGNNVDFPADANITIPGSSTYTFSKSRVFSTPGTHSFFIADYHLGVWRTDWPRTGSGSVVRKAQFGVRENPLLTSGVTLTPATPAAGQPVTATMTVRNDSTNPVNIGLLTVAARDPYGNNVDFPADANITIPGSSTYTYSKTRTFTTPGNYSLFTANLRGSTWDMNYPKAIDGSVVRKRSFQVADNPLVTSGITFSPSGATVGQNVTASLGIRNASASTANVGLVFVSVRAPNGANVDFPGDDAVSIAADSTYTYSKSRTFSQSGKYTYSLVVFHNNIWDRNYPKSANASIIRQGSFTINP